MTPRSPVPQALAYDHLTTLHPIGSSVRDSASYVLWSLSRTLPASALSPSQAQRLAERLLCTACLDRDVSVRRAASAAWQEAVGRWVRCFPPRSRSQYLSLWGLGTD